MIHLEHRDSVAVLRIEHGKANAADSELFDDLVRRLDEVEQSAATAVVLTGTGKIFSAGVDLFRVLDGGSAYLRDFLPRLSAGLERLLTLPRPVVAAVNGHAIAGGCVLACACDRRLMADPGGVIGLTELLVGVPFPVAALETVRELLPVCHLQDVVYRGRTVSPGEARDIGLVDELVEPGALLERSLASAAELGAVPAPAFALTKRLLRAPLLARIGRYAGDLDPEVLENWSRPETLATIRAFLERSVGRGGPQREGADRGDS